MTINRNPEIGHFRMTRKILKIYVSITCIYVSATMFKLTEKISFKKL